jgi:lipoate-protein ligase A
MRIFSSVRSTGDRDAILEQIRFITTEYTYADFSTSVSPALERAVEEGASPSTAILNIFRGGSFTIGVFEDPEKSLDLDYCRKEGITVRRRVNPGGSIWGADGGAILVLYLDTRLTWVPPKNVRDGFSMTLTRLAEAIRALYHIDARYRPLNDVEVNGRKLVATSAKLEKSILTMRLLINVAPANPDILKQAIKTPPEKIEDKPIKDVAARFTCLEAEAGRTIGVSDLHMLAQKTIQDLFGGKAGLVPGELGAEEKQVAAEYQEKYTSDAWFYENSERFRFKDMPPGTRTVEGRHKAPAGLIRVTLLVSENAMRDIIITGDFHPSPYGVLKEMEDALRGEKCRREIVEVKIRKIFERPEVEIPGTEARDFVAAFGKAFQELNALF